MQIPSKYLLWLLRALVLAGGAAVSPQVVAGDVIVDPVWEYRDEVERGEFSYNDKDDIPWIENETEILGLPKSENLIEVDLDQLPSGMTLLVDKTRVAVNPHDRIVRVWLWVLSRSGAENGSFEGFRCETGEYKVYATGNHQRKPPVTKAKLPRWRLVRKNVGGNYRRELMVRYFCGLGESRDADKIRRYLAGDLQGEPIFADW